MELIFSLYVSKFFRLSYGHVQTESVTCARFLHEIVELVQRDEQAAFGETGKEIENHALYGKHSA